MKKNHYVPLCVKVPRSWAGALFLHKLQNDQTFSETVREILAAGAAAKGIDLKDRGSAAERSADA